MSTNKDHRIVQPYLLFEGCCEEALEFYRKALGAEITALVRFKDSPESGMCAPDAGNKIMHSSFRIGESSVLASDGRCTGKPGFQGFSLSLLAVDDKEAERLFAALQDGGQVFVPMGKTAFASRFGIIADRFGVSWTIHARPPGQKR